MTMSATQTIILNSLIHDCLAEHIRSKTPSPELITKYVTLCHHQLAGRIIYDITTPDFATAIKAPAFTTKIKFERLLSSSEPLKMLEKNGTPIQRFWLHTHSVSNNTPSIWKEYPFPVKINPEWSEEGGSYIDTIINDDELSKKLNRRYQFRSFIDDVGIQVLYSVPKKVQSTIYFIQKKIFANAKYRILFWRMLLRNIPLIKNFGQHSTPGMFLSIEEDRGGNCIPILNFDLNLGMVSLSEPSDRLIAPPTSILLQSRGDAKGLQYYFSNDGKMKDFLMRELGSSERYTKFIQMLIAAMMSESTPSTQAVELDFDMMSIPLSIASLLAVCDPFSIHKTQEMKEGYNWTLRYPEAAESDWMHSPASGLRVGVTSVICDRSDYKAFVKQNIAYVFITPIYFSNVTHTLYEADERDWELEAEDYPHPEYDWMKKLRKGDYFSLLIDHELRYGVYSPPMKEVDNRAKAYMILSLVLKEVGMGIDDINRALSDD